MITADSVARHLRSSRHRLSGTVTNVTLSDTEVDEMNQPLEVTTTTAVVFLWHPEVGSETSDGRQVSTGRRVVYLPACTTISMTSRFTYAGVTFEVDDVEDWGVGIVVKVVRTV